MAGAEELAPIKLPAPRMTGGRPLMEALKDRKTTRIFNKAKLSDQTLSNLLWAAWGINRPEQNLSTAPSATNHQEIDIYVTLEKGLYLYEPKSHELKPVLAKDLRGVAGMKPFVKNVPMNLVYVADFSRMRYSTDQIKEFYSAADIGHISENVYLFCASERRGAVIRGLVNKETLAKEMNLRPDQKIVLCQSVGYPKETAPSAH